MHSFGMIVLITNNHMPFEILTLLYESFTFFLAGTSNEKLLHAMHHWLKKILEDFVKSQCSCSIDVDDSMCVF